MSLALRGRQYRYLFLMNF